MGFNQIMNTDSSEIWVYGDDSDAIRGGSGWDKISVENLRENISKFSESIAPALHSLKTIGGDYSLDEIELSLTISASGKVGFLGTGASAGGNATIKLKMKAK
jgi:hypothetical protein